MEEIGELRERVRLLEEENRRLRSSKGEILSNNTSDGDDETKKSKGPGDSSGNSSYVGDLDSEQIERYSRQLLLTGGFGVEGQLKLLNSSVLVVGAGGIGSTGKQLGATCSLFVR